MSLSVKNEVLRDIAMMVRKGSIQFDMNDRPMLDLTRIDKKTGRKIEYCVGSIEYDPESYYGGLQYTLYTSNNVYVPKVDGPRPLDTLHEKELVVIRDKVNKYFDMSLSREYNLNIIENMLNDSEGNIKFPNSDIKPVIYFEPYGYGEHVKLRVDSIFYPDEELFHIDKEYFSERCVMYSATPSPEDAKIVGPADVVEKLKNLNDSSIANILSCVRKTFALETIVGIDKAPEQDVDVRKTSRNKIFF